MTILYDENIPFGREALGTLGSVRACAGRGLTAAAVKDVDLLFVRSVTTVDAALLDGSKVTFVATATSGSDHVDKAYLAQRGITFADALGSNANSVAEYVVAAMLTLAARRGRSLAGMTIGVVGVGHVGSLVVRKAEGLGMRVKQNSFLTGLPLLPAGDVRPEVLAGEFPQRVEGGFACFAGEVGQLGNERRDGASIAQCAQRRR